MHLMQVHSNHHDGATGPRPAQGILGSAFAADRIKDDIIAAQEHFIADETLVQLGRCSLLDLLITVLWIENPGTHIGYSFDLKWMACHDIHLHIGNQGTYNL